MGYMMKQHAKRSRGGGGECEGKVVSQELEGHATAASRYHPVGS